MKNFIYLFLVLAIAGCDANVKPDGDPDQQNQKDANQEQGAEVGSIKDNGDTQGTVLGGKDGAVSYHKNAINDPNSVLSEQVVYFDFDSSDVREEYIELIKHHGKYLALNPSAKVRLEGHTDERGTREYNIALADRRAQSIRKLIMFEGASSNQIKIISYGEEKPAVLEHNESAWRLNRRAEFVYGG